MTLPMSRFVLATGLQARAATRAPAPTGTLAGAADLGRDAAHAPDACRRGTCAGDTTHQGPCLPEPATHDRRAHAAHAKAGS
jgi:hypothetical protein